MKAPSPSLAVSVAALVIATGGASFAAAGMITGADVVDGTLQYKDLSAIAQRKLTGQTGAQVPAGPAGLNGAPGSAGPQGPAGPAGSGRWLLLDSAGAIVSQSGGFSVVAAYPTLPNTAPEGSPSNAGRANGNVYIQSNEPLGNNGLLATIALQNTVDLNGDTVTSGRAAGADSNPEFSGEISASLCAFTGSTGIITNCAPPGTASQSVFVVSPRNSDGSFTVDGARKRFYVAVTGDSSDYVAPPA